MLSGSGRDGRAEPLANSRRPTDLPEAAEARGMTGASSPSDGVVGPLVPGAHAPADRVGGQHDESGVAAIDERDDEREQRAPVVRQDADLARDAEHDERELALP